MKADRVGAANAAVVSKVMRIKKEGKKENPEELQTAHTQQVGETEKSEEKVKGVIRLLQAGHFKGVADVRLRINFYDEIQAIEGQALKSTASGSFETFNQSIQDEISALKESGQLTEEQVAAIDAFLENLNSIQSGFLSGNDLSIESLLNRLQSEFDNLSGLLNPPVPQPPIELLDIEEPVPVIDNPVEPDPTEPPAGEPTPEPMTQPVEIPAEGLIPEMPEVGIQESLPQTTMLDLLNSLQESFAQAMDDLQSELAASSTLPEISEPNGNGKAFEKFLAIYEDMRNGISIDTEEAEILDVKETVGLEV